MEEKKLNTQPIFKKVAKRMINEYQLKKRKNIGSNKKEDTNSVWISKKALIDYLIYDNPMSTGVRIYFGVTGKYSDVSYTCKDGYEEQTNLILVATTSPKNVTPTMANSSNIVLQKKNLSLAEIAEENKSFKIFGGEGMALDDHDMCPPPPIGGSCEEII